MEFFLKNTLFLLLFIIIIISPIYSNNENDLKYIIDKYIRFNKWQEAKKELENYLISNSTNSDAYSLYAEVLFELNLYDDAIIATRTAINFEKNDSNLAQLYNNLGFYYYNKGINDIAIDMYNKSISLRNDIDITYYNIGRLYFDKNDYDNALINWKKYINLSTNTEKKLKLQELISKLEQQLAAEKLKKEEEARLKEEYLKKLKEELEKEKAESKSLETDKNKAKHSDKELEEID